MLGSVKHRSSRPSQMHPVDLMISAQPANAPATILATVVGYQMCTTNTDSSTVMDTFNIETSTLTNATPVLAGPTYNTAYFAPGANGNSTYSLDSSGRFTFTGTVHAQQSGCIGNRCTSGPRGLLAQWFEVRNVCNGTCACAGGRSLCSGRCVTKDNDVFNCGTCGLACDSGRTCYQGGRAALRSRRARRAPVSGCGQFASDGCGRSYACNACPVGKTCGKCVEGACFNSAGSCP